MRGRSPAGSSVSLRIPSCTAGTSTAGSEPDRCLQSACMASAKPSSHSPRGPPVLTRHLELPHPVDHFFQNFSITAQQVRQQSDQQNLKTYDDENRRRDQRLYVPDALPDRV